MYPVLFRIGGVEITSFGVLLGVAALVGIWIFDRELKRSGLSGDAVDAAVAGVIGGIIGAKLLWTLEFSGPRTGHRSALQSRRPQLVRRLDRWRRTGLLMLRWRGVPLVRALAAATPALAIGHAIGRIGCFMVGDDYGQPTELPWAVAFPEGRPPTTVPVHPTQLYETVALAAVAWLLVRWRRAGVADVVVLAATDPRRLGPIRDRVHQGQPAHRRTIHTGATRSRCRLSWLEWR